MDENENIQQEPQLQEQEQEPQLQEQEQESQGNAYESVIAQQREQISTLIAYTENLNKQITSLVQNGAQFNGTGQKEQVNETNQGFNPRSLASDEDYSLESLGKEIGKR